MNKNVLWDVQTTPNPIPEQSSPTRSLSYSGGESLRISCALTNDVPQRQDIVMARGRQAEGGSFLSPSAIVKES